jgi:hypothetical protein
MARPPAFTAFIDPDDERFLPGRCARAARAPVLPGDGQLVPGDPRTYAASAVCRRGRRARWRIRPSDRGDLHVVGGGSNHRLVLPDRRRAGISSSGRTVEATAIGNLAVQAIRHW